MLLIFLIRVFHGTFKGLKSKAGSSNNRQEIQCLALEKEEYIRLLIGKCPLSAKPSASIPKYAHKT